MRLLRVRNVVFSVMVGSCLLAADTASAAYDCNYCWGPWLYEEWCRQAADGQWGKTECVDRNAGWSSCSVGGEDCRLQRL